jgi:hypothetical protein
MRSHSDRNSSVPLGQTSGPLCPCISGFTASLTKRGYSKASIAYRLTLLRDLDQWMRQHRTAIEEFSATPSVEIIPGHRDHRSGDHDKTNHDHTGIGDHHRPESPPIQRFPYLLHK